MYKDKSPDTQLVANKGSTKGTGSGVKYVDLRVRHSDHNVLFIDSNGCHHADICGSVIGEETATIEPVGFYYQHGSRLECIPVR